MNVLRLLSIMALLTLMTACQPGHKHLGNPEIPYAPERSPELGDILHLPTGIYVDQKALLDQAYRSQVVFVGETHDNPASHRLQEEILLALAKHNPNQITLAMEMFTPEQQPVLDRWVAGELGEKEFLKQVGWFKNWRMNFALYRPLLNLAKEHKIPVIALNASKTLVTKLRNSSIADLPEEDQQQLPQMIADHYQQAMVKSVYGGHAKGNAALDGFQRIQTLWDETMAQNLAEYLQSESGKNRQIVVVAGGHHVRFGYGIPRRMFRRMPVSYLLVGSHEIDIPASKQSRLMNIELPQFPMPSYHFVKYTKYEELTATGVKLGIIIDKNEDSSGLIIKKIISDSVAEEHKLQKNDLLTKLNGTIELQEPFDLIYELHQLNTGAEISLTVKRAGEELTVPIKFTERESKHHGMK